MFTYYYVMIGLGQAKAGSTYNSDFGGRRNEQTNCPSIGGILNFVNCVDLFYFLHKLVLVFV